LGGVSTSTFRELCRRSIRIGTQSAIIQPEAGALLLKMMTERVMPAPPPNWTIESVCLGGELCDDLVPEGKRCERSGESGAANEGFQKRSDRRLRTQ
jgi:hypothetical protein